MKKSELRKIIKEEMEEIDLGELSYDLRNELINNFMRDVKKIKSKQKSIVDKFIREHKLNRKEKNDLLEIAGDEFHDMFWSDYDDDIENTFFGR